MVSYIDPIKHIPLFSASFMVDKLSKLPDHVADALMFTFESTVNKAILAHVYNLPAEANDEQNKDGVGANE
jgi:hypothetical protein